ncbi:hypothetical protein CR513_18822, partial [Mucuna pruriens]
MRKRGAMGTESAISGTTFPTTAATESVSSRQLVIFGGLDEAASNKQSRVLTKYELQQHAILAKYERLHSRPQDANRTVSQYCESFTVSNLPSQTIPNPRGNASVVTLRSGRELPQPTQQQELRPTNVDSKRDANSQVPQQDRFVPLLFLSRTLSAKKP